MPHNNQKGGGGWYRINDGPPPGSRHIRRKGELNGARCGLTAGARVTLPMKVDGSMRHNRSALRHNNQLGGLNGACCGLTGDKLTSTSSCARLKYDTKIKKGGAHRSSSKKDRSRRYSKGKDSKRRRQRRPAWCSTRKKALERLFFLEKRA